VGGSCRRRGGNGGCKEGCVKVVQGREGEEFKGNGKMETGGQKVQRTEVGYGGM